VQANSGTGQAGPLAHKKKKKVCGVGNGGGERSALPKMLFQKYRVSFLPNQKR